MGSCSTYARGRARGPGRRLRLSGWAAPDAGADASNGDPQILRREVPVVERALRGAPEELPAQRDAGGLGARIRRAQHLRQVPELVPPPVHTAREVVGAGRARVREHQLVSSSRATATATR